MSIRGLYNSELLIISSTKSVWIQGCKQQKPSSATLSGLQQELTRVIFGDHRMGRGLEDKLRKKEWVPNRIPEGRQ